MTWISSFGKSRVGDIVQLVSPSNKSYIFRLEIGKSLQTHRGVIHHDDLIGISWGCEILSHQGSSFFLFQPSLGDVVKNTKRNTQIMYPKDIGYILVTMGIGPGQHIVEAGTGSGALTTALAWAVGSQGKIISYEIRPEMQNLARNNLEELGLSDRVIFKLKDIADGFDESNLDGIFLDLPNPNDYIYHVRDALKSGGAFGCILPTVNQVERLLPILNQHHFAFIEVCEILLRYYKPIPKRLRPTDRMVAHTGYLIFSRSILPVDDVSKTHDATNSS